MIDYIAELSPSPYLFSS